MDGSIDIKLVLQLLGMLVAVVASLIVAKQQIKVLSESVGSLSKKINYLTADIDVLQQKDSATQTSISTFRDILSPTNLEIRAREIEGLKIKVSGLRRDIEMARKEYLSSHNGSHKYIPPPKLEQN